MRENSCSLVLCRRCRRRRRRPARRPPPSPPRRALTAPRPFPSKTNTKITASFPSTLSSAEASAEDEALAASIAAGANVSRAAVAASNAAAAPLAAAAASSDADADADDAPLALALASSSQQSADDDPADDDAEPTAVQRFLFPDKTELPGDFEMPIWDHLEELRERVLVASLATGAAIAACFGASKELVLFLEAPVADAGVRFLQLSPGEFFFTTFKVAGYCGLLLAAPTVIYEVVAYVVPGLTKSERRFLAPIVLGSSALFYAGLAFSYEVLTPAALNFFVSYAEGAVESLWSIDQYFSFVLVLMLSTGLSFQVPVVQVLLGQLGLVSADTMLGLWRYVVVGATVAAAVLTPSTDPFTQALLAIPLVGLYMGGAGVVKLLEGQRRQEAAGGGGAAR